MEQRVSIGWLHEPAVFTGHRFDAGRDEPVAAVGILRCAGRFQSDVSNSGRDVEPDRRARRRLGPRTRTAGTTIRSSVSSGKRILRHRVVHRADHLMQGPTAQRVGGRLPASITPARSLRRESPGPLRRDASDDHLALPTRPPDHNGWYTHPVSFAFNATDATSGVSGCTNTTYTGPSSARFCDRHLRGPRGQRRPNGGAAALRLDAARPGASVDRTGDGFVALDWKIGADVAPLASIEVTRKPGRRGPDSSVVYRGQAATSATFTSATASLPVHDHRHRPGRQRVRAHDWSPPGRT